MTKCQGGRIDWGLIAAGICCGLLFLAVLKVVKVFVVEKMVWEDRQQLAISYASGLCATGGPQ